MSDLLQDYVWVTYYRIMSVTYYRIMWVTYYRIIWLTCFLLHNLDAHITGVVTAGTPIVAPVKPAHATAGVGAHALVAPDANA